MTYVTHELAGLVFSIAYMRYTKDISLCPLFISVFSSLLPDIDEPQSIIGRKVKKFSSALKHFFGHRGITHSFLGLFIFSGIFYYLLYHFDFSLSLLPFFIIGYLSHLLTDFITVSGIPLFYPWKKRFKIPLFKVNGKGEKFFSTMLSCVLLYQVYLFIRPDLQNLFNLVSDFLSIF